MIKHHLIQLYVFFSDEEFQKEMQIVFLRIGIIHIVVENRVLIQLQHLQQLMFHLVFLIEQVDIQLI